MECWRCGEKFETTQNLKIPFRMTCDKCHACLHSCVNCVNYQPGLPNDCKIPGTDPVRDREASNFCEEFVLKGVRISAGNRKNASDVGRSLFKNNGDSNDNDKDSPEDRFKSLFR